MQTFLTVAFVAVGLGLAAWFALVAHDLGNGFARFRRRAERPATTPKPRQTPGLTARERADGVV